MSTLSNEIENFIKRLMEGSDAEASIQRNELADYFNCAPSQINYVLTTRFSPDRGYIVESRRGGGGYVKIIKVRMDEHSYIKNILGALNGKGLNERAMRKVVEGLLSSGYIDHAHAKTIFTALSDKSLSIVSGGDRDILRAHILKQILLSMLV